MSYKINNLKDKNSNSDMGNNDFRFRGKVRPHIPEGTYEAICVKREQKYQCQYGWKFSLIFQIVSGEYSGTELERHYNYQQVFGPNHNYTKEWLIANHGKMTSRGTLSSHVFKNKVFKVKVRTVTSESKYTNQISQYSKIESVQEVIRDNVLI